MCITRLLRRVVDFKFILLCGLQAVPFILFARETSEAAAQRPSRQAITEGSTYLQSAGVHYRNGRYSEAVANYLDALRHFQPVGEVDSLIAIFNGLGGV